MSQPAVITAQAPIKDFNDWISFDDDPTGSPRRYSSIDGDEDSVA